MPQKINITKYVHAKREMTKVPEKIKKYVTKKIDNSNEKKQWSQALPAATISNTTGTIYYFNWCGGPTTVTASVIDLTPFKLGPGPFQRIGSRIKIHEISYRVCVDALSANVTNAANVNMRIMVVVDKLPEGTAIVTNDFLYDVGSNNAVVSPYKQIGFDEYRILSDKTFSLENKPGNTAGAQWNLVDNKVRKYKKKFNPPLQVSYYTANPTASITSASGLEKNGIALILFSDQASPAAAITSGYLNVVYSDA